MASKKKKYTLPKTGDTAKLVFGKVMAFYMFFMFAIYPLYYQDKYYNMGEAKWIFFSRVSVVFGGLSLLLLIWYFGCFIAKNEFKKFANDAVKNILALNLYFFQHFLFHCFFLRCLVLMPASYHIVPACASNSL